MSSRLPMSEYSRSLIERNIYPNQQSSINKYEGVEIDIRMERLRLNENNSQWLSRQARGLHQEFAKKQ